MKSEKTHYRKVFKSDHLGSADLEEMTEEGKKLIFKIKEVKQEYQTRVAGKLIDANIAYFHEDIKPLVLNSTNSKQVAKFAQSKFVEDWANLTIELFIDPKVKLKGEVVGGVRIRPIQPTIKKEELMPDHKRWDEAKEAVKNGKIDGVTSRFEVSEANLLKLKEV
jgi:hypothetical protein